MPWNYPFQLIISPLVGAISAGNTVTVKPSEISSHTTEVLQEILEHEILKPFITVETGGVEETTNLLKRRFDYIFYTGSTPVGKIVMEAAAKHLTPVTLELGGKSPTVVTKNANIEIAARRILWGKIMNAGQTCIAPDYVLVDEEVRDQFIEKVQQELKSLLGKNPKDSPDYGRIISDRHFERLQRLIPESIIVGGETSAEDKYIAPTVFTAYDDDPIMQDEIFGLLLPILTFKETKEATKKILEKEKPLAFYLFSENQSEIDYFKDNISSGRDVCE